VESGIEFDWDAANITHIARHGVSREEAEQVMMSSPVEIDYQMIAGEERYVVVGLTDAGRFLTMVWTDRSGAVRIITAFDASKENQALYLSERGA
jgi:uncharacterized DUF497 family protein